MSETAPRTNARLDNFEANKAAHEQAQYEDALYGEAGKTDFSDEARRRVEEGDAYERHLEAMSARGEDYDEIANNLEDSEYKDSVDRAINDDPTLRRMNMIARGIAAAYATEVTPENADRLPASIKDKEDKLQELLIAFNDSSTLPEVQKDEIIKRIIDASEGRVAAAGESEATDSTSQIAPAENEDEPFESDSEAPVEPASVPAPEGYPAEEGESQEEYEARYAVDPSLAIDPAEMPIAVPEMPEDNREKKKRAEFKVGDKVRVKRTSGEMEDDWVIFAFTDGFKDAVVRKFDPDGNGVLRKVIPLPELSSYNQFETEEDNDSSRRADVTGDTFYADSDAEHEEGADETPEALLPDSDEQLDEDAESGPDGRARSWLKRAKDAVNGGLTKLYYGIGSTMNKLATNERKEGETDEEYNERMKRNGRRAAVGIVAVAAAWGAYRLYHGIEAGSGGGSGSTGAEHPFNPSVDPSDLGPDTPSGGGNAHSELLNSDAWNIPKGSGGEALMDRLGVDKSVWYQHQDEFLSKFPSEAYRMADGNVGFDDPGRLSKPAIEFWTQYAGK